MKYPDTCKVLVNLWRNAADETREACILPPARRDFYWRAGVISITTDEGFSLFPGIERIAMSLEDGRTSLESADRLNHTSKPLQPFSFTADLAVEAKLTVRQMPMDFNIITHLDVYKVKVRIVERTFTIFGSRGRVVFVINGVWQLGDKLLTTDQGACWFDDRHILRLL